METKRPSIKESVGAQYYAFNTPDDEGNIDYTSYEEVIKTLVVKKIDVTENGGTTTVKASGKDYQTFNQTSSTDMAVEVVAFPPDDLARMRGENKTASGLMQSGGTNERPYFAYGKVVEKVGGGYRYDWYPKCQLIENTDNISTREDSFSEQNDTVTIRAYGFDDEGHNKNYIDSEISESSGITEEKFFAKPIVTDSDFSSIISVA